MAFCKKSILSRGGELKQRCFTALRPNLKRVFRWDLQICHFVRQFCLSSRSSNFFRCLYKASDRMMIIGLLRAQILIIREFTSIHVQITIRGYNGSLTQPNYFHNCSYKNTKSCINFWKVCSVHLEVRGHRVESVHADLVTHEATSVGREGPEHDGNAAFVHRTDAFLLHKVPEDVPHSVVFALGSWKTQ